MKLYFEAMKEDNTTPVAPQGSIGIELIARERKEQIEKHGFSVVDDAIYYENQELRNAAMFALTADEKYYPDNWESWFKKKMRTKRQSMEPLEFDIERLKIAGALIAAEIDRLLKAP